MRPLSSLRRVSDEVVQGFEFAAAGGETGLGDFAELERVIGGPGIDDFLGVGLK